MGGIETVFEMMRWDRNEACSLMIRLSPGVGSGGRSAHTLLPAGGCVDQHAEPLGWLMGWVADGISLTMQQPKACVLYYGEEHWCSSFPSKHFNENHDRHFEFLSRLFYIDENKMFLSFFFENGNYLNPGGCFWYVATMFPEGTSRTNILLSVYIMVYTHVSTYKFRNKTESFGNILQNFYFSILTYV